MLAVRRVLVNSSVLLALGWSLALEAQAQPFPGAGFDTFSSAGVFKLTLSPALGGGTFVVFLTGDTTALRSGAHLDLGAPADVSGPIGSGGSGCLVDPIPGTSDTVVGFHPPVYEGDAGNDEVHTEICDLMLTGGGFTVRAGDSAPAQPPSFGEVEARPAGTGATGFPADSFFNLFFEIDVAGFVPVIGGLTLENRAPLVLEAFGIAGFPPVGADYVHTWMISGRTQLFVELGGPFVGWLEEGTHAVGATSACLEHDPPPEFTTVYSVRPLAAAEGLLQPDPLAPLGPAPPNDVYALGFAPGGSGYMTEGELFQSSGFGPPPWGAAPDTTNLDRISAALGIGPAPGGGPPFHGPFAPNPGAPAAFPAPPGGPGTLGFLPGDNIDALSFGLDGGDVLLFSVDSAATGLPATAVLFNATLAPPAAPAGSVPPQNCGGDPGAEAAGDLYISPPVPLFHPTVPPVVVGLTAAPPGFNILAYDELDLGLQAPAVSPATPACIGIGAPEDDLDALEADDAATVDSAPLDGIPDPGSFVFTSLTAASPTIGAADPGGGCSSPGDFDGVTPDDILVSPSCGVPPFPFAIYASGIADIGLLAGDELDALVLFDGPFGPDGILAGGDEALFSLAAGSPSLLGSGTNPNMAGPGPFSPGDVFFTPFPGPPTGGPILLYASAAFLGLAAADELDALDIAIEQPCFGISPFVDDDGDNIHNLCDNCVNLGNPGQQDCDGDGVGDVCDNCATVFNPLQEPVVCPGPKVPATPSRWGLVLLTTLLLAAGALGAHRVRGSFTAA